MDLIAGLVTITAAFSISAAFAGALVIRAAGNSGTDDWQRIRAIIGTILVVYFVASTHLLLIAQQPGLALGNSAIGLLLVFVQYVEPSLRRSPRPGEVAEDADRWRR